MVAANGNSIAKTGKKKGSRFGGSLNNQMLELKIAAATTRAANYQRWNSKQELKEMLRNIAISKGVHAPTNEAERRRKEEMIKQGLDPDKRYRKNANGVMEEIEDLDDAEMKQFLRDLEKGFPQITGKPYFTFDLNARRVSNPNDISARILKYN